MKVFSDAFKYIRPYKTFAYLSLISGASGVALTLYVPILIGNAVNFIVGKNAVNFPQLLKQAIMLAAVVLIGSLFQWASTLFTNRAAYKAVGDLRKDVFAKLNGATQKYIDSNSHGDLSTRITVDLEMLSDGLLQGFMQVFTGVFTILGTLLFMFSINAYIALAVVVLTPLSMLLAAFIANRSHSMFNMQAKISGELGGYASEIISNHETVKAFRYEEQAQTRYDELNNRLSDFGTKAQFYSSITNPSTRFINGMVFAAVGTFGAIGAVRGILSVGQLTSFLTYAGQFAKPFNEISATVTQLQSAVASAKRVFELLAAPQEVDEGKKKLQGCKGEVSFKNISFSYDKKRPLIKAFSLEIKAGSRVAIVGPTGSGKTTLMNLLMRFYDVDSGDIAIDGTNIKDLTKKSLRSSFGIVLQDIWLSGATVRENIAFGKPSATMEEVISAAKSASAHGFIMRLPQGYDTPLSEGGANISQGEKQLLSIARVMLVDPPMLILDEATSNIDTLTENRIQKSFKKMMEGRTSFIVAHRLSTIRESDIILVMKDGQIVESGTHPQLIEKGGFYCELSGAGQGTAACK